MLAAHTSGNSLKGNLVISEMDNPQVRHNEVLIEVKASSVNPLDWKVLKGIRYVPFKKLVLGHDVAGVIVQTGQDVKTFNVGDEVYCCLPGLIGGANAQLVTASAKSITLKPENISMQEAAATPLAALTAWQALHQARIEKNCSVLIIGASGGVGTFAVQIAKALNAHVTGVCSTQNIDLVRSIGADQIIDYTQQSLYEQEKRFDIIFDTIGNESLHSCRKILHEHGHYITTTPSPRSLVDAATDSIPFASNSQHADLFMMRPDARDLKRVSALIKAGKVKPIIDKQFDLSDIDSAYAYSKKGHSKGKIVINMR